MTLERGARQPCAWALYALTIAGCGWNSVVVVQPAPEAPRPPGVLQAGAAERDITPPPGPPVWGTSIEGAERITGYRQRLKVLALEGVVLRFEGISSREDGEAISDQEDP